MLLKMVRDLLIVVQSVFALYVVPVTGMDEIIRGFPLVDNLSRMKQTVLLYYDRIRLAVH